MDKVVLILFILASFVSAQSFFYVKVNDYTGDDIDKIYVYQNDNMSTHFVKELNTSEMQTLGTGHDLNLVFQPATRVKYDTTSDKPMNYLLYNFEKYWILIVLTGLTLALLIPVGALGWKKIRVYK